MAPQTLTPEERRTLGIAVLTAAATTLATWLITRAIEEGKVALARRRESKKGEAS